MRVVVDGFVLILEGVEPFSCVCNISCCSYPSIQRFLVVYSPLLLLYSDCCSLEIRLLRENLAWACLGKTTYAGDRPLTCRPTSSLFFLFNFELKATKGVPSQ